MSSLLLNGAATNNICTLSLHDALPIYSVTSRVTVRRSPRSHFQNAKTTGAPATLTLRLMKWSSSSITASGKTRSEEHTSELQSHVNLVCRLLLEKKKQRCSDTKERNII